MIYLKLFLVFLEIGAVSFGGGYGMISLIRETVVANGWLSESDFLSFVAVSESTPGPLAVNMATFVGASEGGLFGAFCATAGVVLPAFVIILIIAAVVKGLLKYAGVKAFLGGVRPCVIALILSTALTMLLSIFFEISKIGDRASADIRAIAVFALLTVLGTLIKKLGKKSADPIFMIIISAVLGICFYAF